MPENEEAAPRDCSEKGNHEGKEKASAAQAQPIDVLPCGVFALEKVIVGCYGKVLLPRE
jgi:hypothetical protein